MRPLTLGLIVAAALTVGADTEGLQRLLPDTTSEIDGLPMPPPSSVPYDGGFRFCRIRFRTSPEGDGAGWYVDYPRADENLSIRLSQLTNVPVTTFGEGEPAHVLLRLTDPELFQCPFVLMTEPGGAEFDAQEAAQL